MALPKLRASRMKKKLSPSLVKKVLDGGTHKGYEKARLYPIITRRIDKGGRVCMQSWNKNGHRSLQTVIEKSPDGGPVHSTQYEYDLDTGKLRRLHSKLSTSENGMMWLDNEHVISGRENHIDVEHPLKKQK